MPTLVDSSQFTVSVEGVPVVVPCVEVVVFLGTTVDEAILDFYDRARTALGDALTHYQAESMKTFGAVNARANAMVPTWFTKPRAGKIDYHMLLAGADLNVQVSATTLELSVFRKPPGTPDQQAAERAEWRASHEKGRHLPIIGASKFRLTVPPEHPLAAPEAVRTWMLDLEMLRSTDEFSGYCGCALNYYVQPGEADLYLPAKMALSSFCLRYPGLGWDGAIQGKIFRYDPAIDDLLPLVKRANWLTLLSSRTVEFLGGRDRLAADLGSDQSVSFDDLPLGVAIQAGPEPQTGDLGQRDFLPLYRRVARAVRRARVDEIDGDGKGFMRTATNQWLNAFDVEYGAV